MCKLLYCTNYIDGRTFDTMKAYIYEFQLKLYIFDENIAIETD